MSGSDQKSKGTPTKNSLENAKKALRESPSGKARNQKTPLISEKKGVLVQKTLKMFLSSYEIPEGSPNGKREKRYF